jgi:histone arginine demethylase JMJD6
MALTQNFLSTNNFEKVWRSLRKERKKLSAKLLEKFQEKKPELYQKAIEMNENDGFVVEETKKKVVCLKRERSFEVLDGDVRKKRKISLSSDSNESSSSSSS